MVIEQYDEGPIGGEGKNLVGGRRGVGTRVASQTTPSHRLVEGGGKFLSLGQARFGNGGKERSSTVVTGESLNG